MIDNGTFLTCQSEDITFQRVNADPDPMKQMCIALLIKYKNEQKMQEIAGGEGIT